MSAPKNIPAGQAGYSGCTINARCFYEGSSKERICQVETLCIRDEEVRIGHERVQVGGPNATREEVFVDAEGGAQVLSTGSLPGSVSVPGA